MKALVPYIIFNGNCREAMEYYAEIFDAKITKMQTIAEAPMEFPPGADHRIFDSEINFGSLTIKASDSHPDRDQLIGNNISLFLTFETREQQSEVYNAIAKDGNVMFPLSDNSGLAMLTDKFGISWMLVFHP